MTKPTHTRSTLQRARNSWVFVSILFLSSLSFAQGGGGGGISATSIDCGETDAFTLGNSGFTGDDPTTATGSCGQCCYAGSDLDGDGDQDVSFSTENGVWYEYCNNTGATIDIDVLVDETNNNCNLQGAVFVGPTSGNNTIDCSNSENQEYGSNMNGNADGFGFSNITVPDGECAYIFIDGYAGAACGAATIEIVCPCVPPIVTAVASPTSVCTGEQVTLTASGAVTYTWTASGGGGGLNATTGTSVTANPTATTTYTVTGDDGNGCTATADVVVTIVPPPIPDAGPDQIGCAGEDFIIGADPIFNQEGATYSWSSGAGSGTLDLAGGQQDPGQATVSPASTTVYTVTVTDLNGCVGTDDVTITITAPILPTFDAIPNQCLNDTPPALETTSTNGFTGTWSPATISTATTGTTTYTFTPTAGQCATQATLDVTVGPPPVPTFTQVANVCQDDPAPAMPGTSNEGITGTWSPAVNTSTAGTSSYTFTPDGGQCAATATMDITVDELPTPDAGADQLGCVGDVFVIGGDPVYGENGVPYAWDTGDNGTLVLSGNPNQQNNGQTTVSPGGTSAFNVTITNGDGCVNSDNVTITIDPCVLPIELMDFDIRCTPQTIVSWTTATEYNNSHFTLEKSCDGLHFETIARVDGNGTSHSPIAYEYIDNSRVCEEELISFYRLSQTDYDGTTEHLITRSSACTGETAEPVIVHLNGHISVVYHGTYTAHLYNSQGRLMDTRQSVEGRTAFATDQLQAGVYIVTLDQSFAERVVIVK